MRTSRLLSWFNALVIVSLLLTLTPLSALAAPGMLDSSVDAVSAPPSLNQRVVEVTSRSSNASIIPCVLPSSDEPTSVLASWMDRTNQGGLTSPAIAGSGSTTNRGFYGGLLAAYYDDTPTSEQGDGAPCRMSNLVAAEVWSDPIDFALDAPDKLHDALTDYTEYGVRWVGYLLIPEAGSYTFQLASVDDHARLFIDEELIVYDGPGENGNSWYDCGAEGSLSHDTEETVKLSAGLHRIFIEHIQLPLGTVLNVKWSGPGFPLETIPVASGSLDDLFCNSPVTTCGLNGACAGTYNWVVAEINTYNGNHTYDATDMRMATAGQDLLFQRVYASQMADRNDAGLGHGWSHNYNMELVLPSIGPDVYVDVGGSDHPLCGATPSLACRTISYTLAYQAEYGDTIHVAPGTYAETIQLQSGIAIYGAGADVTFIDGEELRGPMVTASGSSITSTAVISGFTITGGSNTSGNGGGIYVANDATPVIANNVIIDNAADNGGGVYLDNSDATLINNIIVENVIGTAPSSGSGVFINGSDPYLFHTTVARNTGGDGTGIYVSNIGADYSTAHLTNTILVSQTTGIYVYDGNTAILTATLWGSGVWANGTDWLSDGASTIITGTINIWEDPDFIDPDTGDNYHIGPNSGAFDAGADAGVIYDIDGDTRPAGSDPDIGADEYTTCIARLNSGNSYTTVQEAVDASTSSTDVVKVAGHCAGINVRSGVTQTVYVSKTLTIRGGYAADDWTIPDPVANPTTLDAQGQGRVIFIDGSSASITPAIENLHILDGDATGLGGGGGMGSADLGGGIFVYESDATFSGNVITANTADYGGGVFLRNSDTTFINNIVVENESNTAGSGLYVQGSDPHLLHTTITRNTGGGGKGIYVASLVTDHSNVVLTNTILVDQATGIYVSSGNTATLAATLWGSGDWANDPDWDGNGTINTGTINIWDNPGFVNPASSNYHIGPSSSAIDEGLSTSVSTDVDGEPRSLWTGSDLGADELRTCWARLNNGTIYATVQAAVDASTATTDTIKVAGYCNTLNYRDSVTQVVYISKTLTLRGGYTVTNWTTSNPAIYQTTLDAQGEGRVIYIDGVVDGSPDAITPTIENLYITGGDATGLGGGTGSPASDVGGGVFVYENYAILSGNTIITNSADYGGGVYLDSSDATLNGNIVTANTADYGGGLYLYDDSNATLTNNIVVENQVSDKVGAVGSGMFVSGSDPHLFHTTIARNTGEDGSGIYVSNVGADYSTVYLTNTILVSQTTGIYVTSGNTAYLAATLWGTATWANGGDGGGGGTIFTGTVNIWEEPDFVEPDLANNYHIDYTSAAIDAGVNAGVASDIDGDSRPEEDSYDIGADEWANDSEGTSLTTEPGTVLLVAPDGSLLKLWILTEGYLAPYPGVRARGTWTGQGSNVTYTITSTNQYLYRFDTDGDLLEMEDPRGKIISFTTTLIDGGAAYKIRALEADSGRYLDLNYNDIGQLSSVTDSINRTVSFSYDGAGNLTVVTDVRGFAWTYTYTDSHLLETVLDPLGNVVERTEYDRLDRGIAQWNGTQWDTTSGELDDPVRITYNSDGTRTITDGEGRTMTDEYDDRHTLIGQTLASGSPFSRTFDIAFNITQIVDQNGNDTDIAWGECNCNVETVTDALANTTTMDYNSLNHLTALTDALTHTTEYSYSVNMLTVITDALDGLVFNSYDTSNQLTRTVNHAVTTTYAYDALGQRTAITDALDNVTTYGYDGAGRLVTTTNSMGQVTVNEYDAADNLVTVTRNYLDGYAQNYQNTYNLVTEYRYDAAGNRTHVIDTLGHITLYEYDDAGRLIETTVNHTDISIERNYLSQYNIVTQYGYDNAGNQTHITDTLGYVTWSEYDSSNRLIRTTVNYTTATSTQNYLDQWNIVTEYAYDAAGNPTHVTDTLGYVTFTEYDELNRPVTRTVNYSTTQAPDTNIMTTYQYDAVGNVVTTTDTLSRMTITEYDNLNRPITVTTNYGGSDTMTTTMVYNAETGKVTARVRISGTERITTTTYTYDAAGRVETETDAEGHTTTYTYDDLGRRTDVTDAKEMVTHYTYDAAGRLASVIENYDPLGTGNDVNLTTSYAYNALGQRTVMTNPLGYATTYTYDALGRLIATTDPMTGTTQYAYDALGRRIVVTDPTNIATTYTYDHLGRQIEVQDALGYVTQYSYDALGNQVEVTVEVSDTLSHTTRYEYDGLGRMTAMIKNYTGGAQTRDQDVRTEYGYDKLGNTVAVTNALGYTTVYTYDGLNRLVAAKDAENNVTTYSYNDLSQRTTVVYPDGGSGITVRTTYNLLGWPTEVSYPTVGDVKGFTVQYNYNEVGNRTSMIDNVGTTLYAYDDVYRLTSVTSPITGVVSYAYDKGGNRINLTYPTGEVVTYTYDAASRLSQVEDWESGQTAYGYDDAGRVLTVTLPNGVQTTYDHDDAGRLIEIEHRNAAGGLLARYEYELNGIGNRTRTTEFVLPAGAGGLASMLELDGGFSWTALPEPVEGNGLDAEIVASQIVGYRAPGLAKPAWSVEPALPVLPDSEIESEEAHTPLPLDPAGLPLAGPAQSDPVDQVIVRLERSRLTADGRDETRLVVLVTNAAGRAVADGTLVYLQASGGQISPAASETSGGMVFARLQAGSEAGFGSVTASAGGVSAEAPFELVALETNELRLDDSGVSDETPLPFDLAEVVEQSRNAIQVPVRGLPFVERQIHRALFGLDGLHFVPLGGEGLDVPLTLTVQMVTMTIGGQPLYDGSTPIQAQVESNVAHLGRGGIVEEFVALDGGVEQRWWIESDPELSGELVVAVEVETALELAQDEEGFLFRAASEQEGSMLNVAHYDRALAIDANGISKWAQMSALELEPPEPGLHRYRLEMSFPAEWMAQASYPLLIDPLIGSLLRLDAAYSQSGSQVEPATAYNSTSDEYLVVWEDDRISDDDVWAQFVSSDGLLSGENFTVTSASGSQTIPDVAYNSGDDNYLVVWRNGTTIVQGRILNASGSLSPTVLTLASSVTTLPDSPAVAYSPSADHWLVVWEQSSMAAHLDIWARAVDGEGTTLTAYDVYTATLDDTLPDVIANDDEQFLVVWQRDDGASSHDIHARRVTITGVANAAFSVNTSGSGIVPQVTYNEDDDEYLVVWQDPSTTYDTIWTQRVLGDHSGGSQLNGSNTQVSDSGLTQDCQTPAVTYFTPGALDSGIYLVAWKQQAPAATTNLMARRVETDGTVLTPTITLCDADDDQSDVALAFGPVVTETLAAWTDERNGNEDVYGVIVDAGGDVGNDFLVHSLPGDQQRPQVAYNPDDDEYLVVWQDYRGGTYADIYGQRVTGAGVLAGDNITITEQPYNQTIPHVAYATGGDVYLVAWRHYPGSATTEFNVHGQIISHTGTLSGSNFTIANYASGTDRETPTDIVYNDALDYFLVLYQDLHTAYWNIWGRHVSSSGVMSDAVQITTLNTKHETSAVGAYSAPDDLYLIVYMYRSAPGQPDDVYGRRMWGNETVENETIYIATGAGDQQNADVIYLPDADRYLVVWEDDGAGNFDLFAQLVKDDGTLDGSNYTIDNEGDDERLPRLDLDSADGALIVWQRDVGGTTDCDLYGQRFDSNGSLISDPFTILQASGEQQRPVVASDTNGEFLLTWQDDRNGGWDVYDSLFQALIADFSATPRYGPVPMAVAFTDVSMSNVPDEWLWTFGTGDTSSDQNPVYTYTQAGVFTVTLTVTDTDTATGEWDTITKTAYITAVNPTVITYTYDGLDRLSRAEYSTGMDFTYAYDEVGNRITMTRKITTTVLTTTYDYDHANRLTDRAVSDGRAYTYTWSERGQMLAEWTVGSDVRTFTYDGAGRMVEATVFTLTTNFTYDGAGRRLIVEVEGHSTTTYTVDYAAGGRVLAEDTITGTLFYLYGHDCLGQFEDSEWLFYLADATRHVRQGVDEQEEIQGAWLFDADGTIVEGPEGLVSHLVCGGVYDWSTGLIWQNEHYFDPMLGIWLALAPLVVVEWWRRSRKKRRELPWMMLVVLVVGMSVLTGCGPDGTPTPEEFSQTICTDTPMPEDFGISVTLHSPSNIVRDDEWTGGGGDMWQVRLGDYHPTEANAAGAYVQARITPPNGYVGEVRFEQHTRFKHTYYFGGTPHSPENSRSIGDNSTWYLDGESPLSQYADSYACGSGICGTFLDSPGSALEMVEEGTGLPLVNLVIDQTFQTYLLWYPTPGCRIPLARIQWSWKARVIASENVDAFPGEYPYEWDILQGSFKTNPPLNIETSVGEPISPNDKIYGPSLPSPPSGEDILGNWSNLDN